jgi:P2-related tail formation protein
MSLLPYNSTKFERDVEQAIKYAANVSFLYGFKFENTDPQLRLSLAWEYSLAQVNIDDFAERVLKGLEFHRLRGTPAALRNALSWYGFDNIIIEEEPPGEHFADFQIGIEEIPNGDLFRIR